MVRAATETDGVDIQYRGGRGAPLAEAHVARKVLNRSSLSSSWRLPADCK